MLNPIIAADIDPWEHWSFVATIAATLFTVFWAIKQWRDETARRREDLEKERESRRDALAQQQQELRWKQAQLARKMMDAIFDYRPSNDAWRMVDGEMHGYKDSQGNEYQIDMNMVRSALPDPNNWNERCGGPDVYVRWCFDALFYYLEQIEHAIQLNILRFEDVEAAAAYYVVLMARDKKLFEDYAIFIRLKRAVKFMERFPEWKDAKV